MEEIKKNENKLTFAELEKFVNADWENGRSLLHIAVNQDDFKLVKYCIQLNADVNKIDHYGRTPMFFCKSLKIAKFLVDNGIEVNILNYGGQTAVVDLYHSENIDIIKYLAGITNLDLVSGKLYSATLLEKMIILREKDLSLFEIALPRTKNKNRIDSYSNSYLLSAVKKNKYLDVVMMLAKSGIDLYIRDENGKNFYDLSFQYVKKKIEKEFPDFMKYKDLSESQRQRKFKLDQLNIISN
jgi:ankyrin repeat protein